MQATVIYSNNPFHPARDRKVVNVKRKQSIAKLAPKIEAPHICLLNGKPLLRKDNGWERTIDDNDFVCFVVVPQGGGGGGSNPLKMILAITVSVLAPQLAVGILGPVAGTTTLGGLTFAGSVLTAGISFVGNALVNALIRDPVPSLSNRSISAIQAASPTYNLSGQGNQARIGQAIPVMYGRNMIYMDYAAQPYTEYAGNEQYLYQLFVIGQGEYDIEQILLEDTVIENDVVQDGNIYSATGSFEEIQYQVCYNQNVTLFPQNVNNSVEVSGQESNSVSGTYSQSGTTITVTRTAHGYVAGEAVYLNFTSGTSASDFYTIATNAANTFTVTAAASATTSGNVVIADVIGSFVANDANTFATAIGFDVVLPRGLYYANDNGGLDSVTVTFAGQYRQIDDSGTPIGSWVTGFTGTQSLKTTTPQRFTYRVGVAAGRYECRFARTNLKQTDTRYGNDVNWAGLRSYLATNQNYGNLTMLAMRMKASNQLNQQSSRRINTVSTRKLSTYDGNNWGNAVATRNPAWAFADIVTASYGMGLSLNRIDANQLFQLAAVFDARQDRFDAIYDGQQPAWEALTQVCRVGRSMPYLQGGNVYMTRDSQPAAPVAMFTMRNIAKNSLKLSYLLPSEETADAVDVEYWDNGTFQQKVVRSALPGSLENSIVNRQLFGCSSRAQAYREGMYMAACNRYRRRMVSFTTEMEGFIPTVGDLIAIQHDMPQWGQGGEVVGYDAGTLTLTLSEPISGLDIGDILLEDNSRLLLEDNGAILKEINVGGNPYYIALRQRDGSATESYEISFTANPYQIVLNETPAITPDVGYDREKTYYAIGEANRNYIEAKVLGVKPRALEKIEINAVIDSDFVYTADTGVVPSDSDWQLQNRITKPVIRGLLGRSDPNDASLMFLSWQPAAGADRYLIEISDSGEGWTRIGETSTANYTAVATYGNRSFLRVAGVGSTRGDWVEINYGSSASYMWSGNSSDLMWNSDDTVRMWRY